MHFRTRNKLKTATKIYTVEPEEGKVAEIKVQLRDGVYVQFYLNLPFPNTVTYISLSDIGFNYDPDTDTPIFHNSAKETIKKLRNSFDYSNNNSATIEELIKLIETMHPHI